MKEILESLGLGEAVVAKFRDENVSRSDALNARRRACDIAESSVIAIVGLIIL